MFKPLVIGSRMELVPKKSLRNKEERIVYASQILDFNDDSIVCAMPIYEGRIVPGSGLSASAFSARVTVTVGCEALLQSRLNV